MIMTIQSEALCLLSSAVQNLANFVNSGCPRAERQTRIALDGLEKLDKDPDIEATCSALEAMMDRLECH